MNIACGGTISVNEIYRQIAILLKKEEIKPQYLPERKGEIKDSFADISLSKKIIGYQPLVDIYSGLEKAVNWYEKHT
jgi:nucleoside-diphosphate-sugar epimerase